MSYRVTKLFHPTHRTPDLDGAEKFFRTVFGRVSARTSNVASAADAIRGNNPDYPLDYAIFTTISDVVLETLDPSKYVVKGHQYYPTITSPHYEELAWYVEGVDELFEVMRSRGMRFIRQHGSDPNVLPPKAAFADLFLFWADPEETGLRYELYDSRGGLMDPRKRPDWTPEESIAPEFDGDPLGILGAACHTILTNDPARGVGFMVDVLGGKVIHEGPSAVYAASSTYVSLGDGVYEYAVPHESSVEREALAPALPRDSLYSIVWHVADLDQVRAHLEKSGVRLRSQTAGGIVVNADDSIGIPFGFSTDLVPGDPRAGA